MSNDPLQPLASRASADPFFLGHALTQAQLDLGLSDLGLARRLGCAVEALAMLRLCRLPKDRGEVELIAARFGCDPQALAELAGVGPKGKEG
jgi:hypothetical protein